MGKKIEIDSETVDRITLLGLTEHRAYLRKALRDHKKGTNKLHPEDLGYDTDMLEHFNKIIGYYGGK